MTLLIFVLLYLNIQGSIIRNFSISLQKFLIYERMCFVSPPSPPPLTLKEIDVYVCVRWTNFQHQIRIIRAGCSLDLSSGCHFITSIEFPPERYIYDLSVERAIWIPILPWIFEWGLTWILELKFRFFCRNLIIKFSNLLVPIQHKGDSKIG